jgi:hypothetical protein
MYGCKEVAFMLGRLGACSWEIRRLATSSNLQEALETTSIDSLMWLAKVVNHPALEQYQEERKPAWREYSDAAHKTWDKRREALEALRENYKDLREQVYKKYSGDVHNPDYIKTVASELQRFERLERETIEQSTLMDRMAHEKFIAIDMICIDRYKSKLRSTSLEVWIALAEQHLEYA